MEHPKVRIEDLKKLHNTALKISPVGKQPTSTTMRTYFAEQIFEKALLVANSFVRLIPDFDKKDILQCDFSTLASLSRNLIELNHVYNYLCKDRLSEDELEFRVYLMGIHYSHEIKKVLQKMSFSKEYTEANFSILNMVCQSVLNENSYFACLDKKIQNELLKGKKAFYWNRPRQRNLFSEQNIEISLYKLFSNHIHSFQLGIQTQFLNRDKSPFNLISLFFLATEAAITCYAWLLRSYMALRWRRCKNVSEEEKLFVKHCSEKTQITEWIRYQEEKFVSDRISIENVLATITDKKSI